MRRSEIRRGIGYAGKLVRSALPGLAMLAPLMPVLVLCIASSHLNFTPHGLNRLGLVVFVVAVSWQFPTVTPHSLAFWSLIAPVAILGIWMSLAGFMSWAFFLGLAAIMLWREGCRVELSASRAAAPILVLAAICLPTLSVDHITIPRNISLWIVDRFLMALGIAFERVGVTYFLTATDVTVLESCSGTATWRVAFALLGLLCIYQRRYRAVLYFALPASAILALTSNALRIALHILLTVIRGAPPEPAVHTLLGTILFAVLLLPVVVIGVRLGKCSELATALRCPDPRGWRMRAAFLLLLAGSAMIGFVVPWDKHIEHDFVSVVGFAGGKRYVNSFVEHRGGAGWGLLDHPLEYCASQRGWTADSMRLNANRRGAALSTRFFYGSTPSPQSSRNSELRQRMFNPARWFTPLHVRVEIDVPIERAFRSTPP